MNHAERIELIAALQRAGVGHYKSHDLEISFRAGLTYPVQSGAEVPTTPAQPSSAPLISTPPPVDPQTAEKIKDLVQTLKLGDVDLANKLFPDGAESGVEL